MKKQLLILLLTAATVPAIIEEIQQGQKEAKTSSQAAVVRIKCPKCR